MPAAYPAEFRARAVALVHAGRRVSDVAQQAIDAATIAPTDGARRLSGRPELGGRQRTGCEFTPTEVLDRLNR